MLSSHSQAEWSPKCSQGDSGLRGDDGLPGDPVSLSLNYIR